MTQTLGTSSSLHAEPCPMPDDLHRMLDKLTRAREALDAARSEWRAAGAAAQQALRECGSQASWKDQQASPTLDRLMHSLFWDFPEIGPVCIAEAFGLDGSYQVNSLVCAADEA